MIYYPIQSMVDSGIKEIMLVCGGNDAGDFLRVLGSGEQFGLKHLDYTYQPEPKGIADALSRAEYWADGEPVCVMLGDNFLEKPFAYAVNEFVLNPNGARIFLSRVENPECYGVVCVKNGIVTEIVEKPVDPKSNLVAIGLYMYDGSVWGYLKTLSPSKRNELEITDLNNRYLQMNKLEAYMVDGAWMDCGESLEGYTESCCAVYALKKGVLPT